MYRAGLKEEGNIKEERQSGGGGRFSDTIDAYS
jgi:hypothetical protein